MSVADLAYGWRILDRNFPCVMDCDFRTDGLSVGKDQVPHDGDETGRRGRFFLALVSLAFAVYDS